MTSSEARDELVGLPQPKRAVWWVVVVVGAAMALFGGSSILPELVSAPPMAYLVAGAGLFLAFFGLAMLGMRERSSSLRIGPESLSFVTRGGDEVALPWWSLRQALAMPQGSHEHVVALRKSDGGWVEVASFGHQESAQRLAGRLQASIDEAGRGEPPSREIVPGFEELKGIEVSRQGDRVELSWAASSLRSLLVLGPMGGMFLIIFGFHRHTPGMGTLVGMGFAAALVVIVLVFTLVNLGAEQRLAIEAERLVVQRCRGGKVIDEKILPITQVAAIDYTHRLNVIGASSITIRSDAVRLGGEAAERRIADIAHGDSSEVEVVAVGSALLKAIAGGVHVPMGRLPLPTRVGLDLALSEEVARRAGRPAGTV